MDKLERDWLKLVVLLVDMAASFVLTAISLSKHRKESHSDVQVEAVLSGVTIVVAVLVYALCVILISVSVQTQSLLTAGGGLFFFIGDNLPPLVGEYGKQVSCDQECVEVVQILGIIMPQLHTWQPLSMCRQNSVRGQPENSLCQERTHAEWFSQSKCLELLPHVGIKRNLDVMRRK